MADFLKMIELAEKLGLIQAVKAKLVRQPDPAADKLVVVLEELSKIYLAIESELVRYLSLSVDAGNVSDERAVLLTLEGGQIRVRINEARGHCHKIKNIFDRFLDPWFQRILSLGERDAMRDLFDLLGGADSGMIADLESVGNWLTVSATSTLNLVDANKYDEANNGIKAARLKMLPTRQAMNQALSDLRKLQADFIQVARVV